MAGRPRISLTEQQVTEAMREANGSVSYAARQLDVSDETLRSTIKKLGLDLTALKEQK